MNHEPISTMRIIGHLRIGIHSRGDPACGTYPDDNGLLFRVYDRDNRTSVSTVAYADEIIEALERLIKALEDYRS